MRKLYSAANLILALICSSVTLAQQANEKTVKDLVKTNAGRLHISQVDADNVSISSYFTDPSTGILYTYIQQTWNGIKVHNTIITAVYRDGKLLYSAGNFVPNISAKAVQSTPSLTADQAVVKSAQHLQLATPSNMQAVEDKFNSDKKIVLSPAGIAKQNIIAELVWVTDDALQTLKLAWNVNIDVLGSSDWWNVRIDAINGNYIEKDNWTVYEDLPGFKPTKISAQQDRSLVKNEMLNGKLKPKVDFLPTAVTNASYRVVKFPGENPNNGMATENEPWLKAGAGNNATSYGWHYDGTFDYDVTRGNNVWAYLDILNTNTASATNCPDTSSTAIPSLTFVNLPNFTNPPATILNRRVATDNLFYWNNLMHDVMYQYGFNEASGNFQADNIGRGGAGGDFVRAEAQDASGTNNANFSSPTDGISGRMQMYLFSPVPGLVVNSPAVIAGTYTTVESAFSTNNLLVNTGPVTGQLVYYNDNAASTHEGCVTPANTLTGKIALINRGNCNFTVKVKNAQDAGAIAVVMVNNVAGDPIVMGGTDNTITIPAVMISQADGAAMVAQLASNVNITITAGVNRDGDLDNGVICHEYGHGISNRLTGGRVNASCLSNAEQGGEGWSDYFALMMVTNWSTAQLTDGNLPRPLGTYVLGQSAAGGGIRTYPYTFNMSVNPHTYADVAGNPEVHTIGEVWASALWDMTWNIIQQEGTIEPNLYNASSNGGNAIALRLVMEGLRLQTCRPGFLDARNAILAADSILYNYRHKCAIWGAFARRGMGVSAVQGSSGSTADQTAAFDVPSAVSLTKTATPSIINQGAQVTVNLAATCGCQAPANNYTIRDTIPAGFSYVSSTGGSFSGNIVTFSAVNFTNTLETKTYSLTLQSSGSGCNVDTAINDNRDGSTIGGLTPVEISGTFDWTPSNLRYSSPSNSWYAADLATATDFALVSNPFTAGNLSVLSLKHYYVLENSSDGGRIEISNDNGTTWMDAGPYIVQNGYNTVMNIGSPWGNGAKAFSGVSYGQGSGQFITTVVDLSSFASQTIRIRLRMATNAVNVSNSTYEGWFVDDILHMNGCGGIIRAGIYNPGGTAVDNTVFPVFVKGGSTNSVTFTLQPGNVTVCENNSATFNSTAGGVPSPTYQWQVSTDGGVTYSDIPGEITFSLTVYAIAGMNGYKYRVNATNGVTSATSSAGTLTVNRVVNVTTHPGNASACGGTNANFAVAAAGSGTLTYKWQVSTDGGTNYADIAGQTTPNLSVAVVNGMDGYKYRSVVSGSCGSATSNAATLTVAQQTQVTITSLPSKICVSDSAKALEAIPSGGTWSGPGVTGAVFTPSVASIGTHTLTYTYTNGAGCVSTGTITAKVDACTERNVLLSGDAIILYPNPNNGKFSIKMNSALYTKLSMHVYSYNGQLVRTQEITGLGWGRTADINLSNLAASVYMVKFTSTEGSNAGEKTFKVIIAGH